jgi:hypothetical protein
LEGHCLATGIVEEEFVRRIADRLFADDMFSGWGIRTLSDRHPAYSPYSYHRGSVWPVEHGSFSVGLVRYGLHEHVERICRAQFEAASLFDFHRLPELFTGHHRDAGHPFPAHYPNANSPQACRHRPSGACCRPCSVYTRTRRSTCCSSIHICLFGCGKSRSETSTQAQRPSMCASIAGRMEKATMKCSTNAGGFTS